MWLPAQAACELLDVGKIRTEWIFCHLWQQISLKRCLKGLLCRHPARKCTNQLTSLNDAECVRKRIRNTKCILCDEKEGLDNRLYYQKRRELITAGWFESYSPGLFTNQGVQVGYIISRSPRNALVWLTEKDGPVQLWTWLLLILH